MDFSISTWSALSPYHQSVEDWLRWFDKEQEHYHLSPCDIDLSFLPAMKRRRLSGVARLMFAAAWSLLPENRPCPVVFVSHDGEVNRSFQLWQDLLQDGEMSPTAFALSVHNAIVGQWSLLRGDMSECVAISAKQNGLEMGVLEALGLLNEGHGQVLVVVVDEPILPEYGVLADRAPFAHALALMVQKGDGICLSHTTDASLAAKKAYCCSTLTWIENQVRSASQWHSPSETGTWQWQLKP